MKSLGILSDQELTNRLRHLVRKEHNLTLEIIPHLVEVIRRGLHLARGYGSLFEYCKGELGYTDASAWRRARAAHAIVRCPEALDRLKEGRVNLCTLGRVSKFITSQVLAEIDGKSKAEVELIAAAYDAKGASPDRTRPVLVPKAVPAPAGGVTDRLRSEVTESDGQHAHSLRSEVANKPLQFEQKWKIEAVVSKEIKAKLDRCKSLLSRKYPQVVDYETLLGELAEAFLERVDPERKQRRRKKHPVKKSVVKKTSKVPASRYIPDKEKEKVWLRDKGRCTYVGTNGKRCNSTHSLQFDHHPVPFSRGGPGNAGNLRLLCAEHNRFTAEKMFGCPDYSMNSPRSAGGKREEKTIHCRE